MPLIRQLGIIFDHNQEIDIEKLKNKIDILHNYKKRVNYVQLLYL